MAYGIQVLAIKISATDGAAWKSCFPEKLLS
jgi:hypothetical protein